MDIEKTKEIIDYQVQNNKIFSFGKSFAEYQKVYAFTNENIDGYMSNFILNDNDNVLSVLASGDHIFNLIYNGVSNIDTFDVNRLTEYYFYLKLAMLNSISYNEFINFIDRVYNNDIEYENDMLLFIIKNMDIKYRKYYEEIIMYSNNIQKNNDNKLSLLKMLLINTNNDYKYKNTYLLNEENYTYLLGYRLLITNFFAFGRFSGSREQGGDREPPFYTGEKGEDAYVFFAEVVA